MPTPQNYSFIAIAVSAALASMVFPSGGWVDVDSLPSSGLVSQLPPELQAIIPAQASTGFTKVGTMPNYVYQWNTGTIPVYGNGLTLNGPGAEAFEHTVTVIQNSGTGSPGVIFGNDLTIRRSRRMPRIMVETSMASVLTAQILRITRYLLLPVTVPTSTWMVRMVTVLTPDITHWAGLDRIGNIYVGDDLYIKTTGSGDVELQLTPCGMRHVPKIRLSSAIVHILLLPATVRRGCVPDKVVR